MAVGQSSRNLRRCGQEQRRFLVDEHTGSALVVSFAMGGWSKGGNGRVGLAGADIVVAGGTARCVRVGHRGHPRCICQTSLDQPVELPKLPA